MKAVLQRVSSAAVKVDSKNVGAIGAGLLILLGVAKGDDEQTAEYLAAKAVEMRIFNDDNGKMNLCLKDVGGSVLLVSQFTLSADWKKGRRPSFLNAAEPAEGNRLYEYFGEQLRKLGVEVATGVFGAHMEVSLVNDGPVTILLDWQRQSPK